MPHARSLGLFVVCILIFVQNSCANANIVSSTPTPAATNTTIPVTNTLMPTKTTLPSQTPGPSPEISGMWSEEVPMLIPRSAHAVVASETTIYALAGTDDSGKPVLEVEAFDGKKWTTETTLPVEGLNAPTASIVGHRLYVVGGFTAVTNVPTAEVRVYDLQRRQWTMASPLPNPRGGHAAVVLNAKIHIFGGGNSISTIADHSEYDPIKNTWRELAPLPRAEGSPAAVVAGGKIYVIGGRSGFSDFGDVYIYDAETDTWSTGPSIEP